MTPMLNCFSGTRKIGLTSSSESSSPSMDDIVPGIFVTFFFV
jgi:hypothetical protein